MANKFLSNINLSLNKAINVANGTVNNDAVNKGQLDAQISAVIGSLSSALQYKGSFDASAADYAVLDNASQGDFYVVSVGGTIGSIEYKAGDHIVVNKDVTGTPVLADIDLIKNTEFTDATYLDAIQTLLNKTVDADFNTITNIVLAQLKAGVLSTDLSIASEGSLSDEINALDYNISDFPEFQTLTVTKTNSITNKFYIKHNGDNLTLNSKSSSGVLEFNAVTGTLIEVVFDADYVGDIEASIQINGGPLKPALADFDYYWSYEAAEDQIPSALAVQTHVATEVTALETKISDLVFTYAVAGDDTTSEFVVNHGLNSESPLVRVMNSTTKGYIFPEVELTDANNATVKFSPTPATGEDYMVIVWGTNF